MNKKTMSKRELVSYIHALTGISFKKSRRLCKKAKYNYTIALYYAYLLFGTYVNQDSIAYYKDPFINPRANIIIN